MTSTGPLGAVQSPASAGPSRTPDRLQLVPWEEVDPAVTLRLLKGNRRHLELWAPRREPGFYSLASHRKRIAEAAAPRLAGRGVASAVVLLQSGEVVGGCALTGIERGPFQRCHLGCWTGAEFNDRGYATEAIHLVVDLAFAELALHRVEAAVMPRNLASQRVLVKSHFRPEGLAEGVRQICREMGSGHSSLARKPRPDFVPAAAGLLAAEADDGGRATDAPAHARQLHALGDHGPTTGLHSP